MENLLQNISHRPDRTMKKSATYSPENTLNVIRFCKNQLLSLWSRVLNKVQADVKLYVIFALPFLLSSDTSVSGKN